MSIQRAALAWVLGLYPTNVVICGASRPETIRGSALAGEVVLSDDGLARTSVVGKPLERAH